MSNNKQGSLGSMSHPRDQQFQVQTLTQNSSEDSSRKDNENYQVRYFDASDQQQKSKKLVKSMEDLNLSPKSQKHKDISKAISNNQSLQKQSKQQINEENTNQFEQIVNNKHIQTLEVTHQSPLQKRKRKRQKIFQNFKRSSGQKQRSQQSNITTQKTKTKNTLNRIVFEKKRENHSLLKQWNYQRIKNLQFHKKIFNELLKNIDKNVKLSLQNLEVFRNFIIQRSRQQQGYTKQIFANSERFIEDDQILQQNSLSRNIYIACGSIYQAVARKDKRQKQLSLQFSKFIDTKIIKQLFSTYFDKIHKESLGLRSKINTFKQSLHKIDENLCKKLIALQTNFTQCCQNINIESFRDFYSLELSFLRKCETQMAIETRLGQQILEYLKFVIRQEQIRKKLIEDSLRLYIQAKQKYEQGMRQLSKTKNNSTKKIYSYILQQQKQAGIHQMYALENLLQPNTYLELKQKITHSLPSHDQNQYDKKTQISAKQFNCQMNVQNELRKLSSIFKCQIKQFDCHHLIMKKFSVEILKQNKWIPGEIAITVDKYVHIFINALRSNGVLVFSGQNFYKPQATIKANQINIQLVQAKSQKDYIEGEQDLQLIISQKIQQKGLSKLTSFLKSIKKIQQTLKFSKQSDLLQFQDYILQLSN